MGIIASGWEGVDEKHGAMQLVLHTEYIPSAYELTRYSQKSVSDSIGCIVEKT